MTHMLGIHKLFNNQHFVKRHFLTLSKNDFKELLKIPEKKTIVLQHYVSILLI